MTDLLALEIYTRLIHCMAGCIYVAVCVNAGIVSLKFTKSAPSGGPQIHQFPTNCKDNPSYVTIISLYYF